MTIPLMMNESDHTHDFSLDTYIHIKINYQESKPLMC